MNGEKLIQDIPVINQVQLYHVRLPLQRPFQTSFGRESHRDSVLVRIQTDELSGWGEAPVGRFPRYTHESSETAWYILTEFLGPALLKIQPDSYRDWVEQTPFIRGHAMAQGAVVMGLIDLVAKQKNVSLSTLYGADRHEAYSGISIGIQERPEKLLERIEASLEHGYRRIKIKIDPEHDIGLLETVREKFPKIDLMADGNGAYDKGDFPTLEQIDRFHLMMIEQPFAPASFQLHADFQNRIETPVCLDESIETIHDAQLANDLGSAQIINIKQSRVGGPINALQLYQFCETEQLDVFCGGLLETGIGRAHNVALASLPRFQLPGDLSESRRYFPEDVVDPEFELTENQTIALPDNGSGICVQPRLEFIQDRSVRIEHVSEQER